MKKWMVLFFLIAGQFAVASLDERVLSKPDSHSLKVTIKSDPGSAALKFTDGKENRTFINSLLNNENSELFKLKLKIVQDFCAEPQWGCGQISYGPIKRVEVKNKGVAWAMARYEFLLGITTEGKAPQFYPRYSVLFKEETHLQNKDTLIKTYELGAIKEVEDNTP